MQIGKIAEQSGIQALTIHGRTKECLFEGEAEYDNIRAVKQSISIPVIANGDIDSASKAKKVLEYTGADAIMIGRAALGNPWLFQAVEALVEHDTIIQTPSLREKCGHILDRFKIRLSYCHYQDFLHISLLSVIHQLS